MMLGNNFAKIEKKLRVFQSLKADQNWKAETRAFLVGSDQNQSVFQTNLRFALIVSLIVVFLLGSTSILTLASLPGEPLYPVKRRFEKLQLSFTQNSKKLSLQQNLAEKRIVELNKIVSRNSESSTQAIIEVENSVTEIKEQVNSEQKKIASLLEAGKSPEEIKTNLTALVPKIEERQEQLEHLEATLPEDDQNRIQNIIGNLEQIKTEISAATKDPAVKSINFQEDPKLLSPIENQTP